MKVEASHLLRELDVLVLYYGLLEKTYLKKTYVDKRYEASEFSYYFPKYQRTSNDFEKQELSFSISQKLYEMRERLLSTTICVKTNVRVGEYDCDRKGFPILLEYSRTEGMKSSVTFADYSKSASAILGTLNMISSSGYSSMYSTVNFDNIRDGRIFPSFISVDEITARRIIGEFGRGEDPIRKVITESMGQKYKGHRTALAYVLFEPKAAKAAKGILEGMWFTKKEIHGNGIYVVFATKKGTVFGVYPKIQYWQHSKLTANIGKELSLRKVLEEWLEACKRKDLERYMAGYADNAQITLVTVVMGEDMKSVKLTKQRLRKNMKEMFNEYDEIQTFIDEDEEKSLEIEEVELHAQIDVCLNLRAREKRKYCDHWIKNIEFIKNGGWKIYKETWNIYKDVPAY